MSETRLSYKFLLNKLQPLVWKFVERKSSLVTNPFYNDASRDTSDEELEGF